MSNKYRSLSVKSRFSLRYPILFAFLALSLLVSVADKVNGQQPTPTPTPDPDVRCVPTGDLKQKGCWTHVFSSGPIVHATVLPNGHLLNWSSYPSHAYARVWNCDLNGVTGLCSLPADPNTANKDWFTTNDIGGMNVFCSGHSLMSNGEVLVAGGVHPIYFGESKIAIFNYKELPPTGGGAPWKLYPYTMNKGRWYPTNVALGNGETLVASGIYKEVANGEDKVNNIPEVIPAPTPTPTSSPAPTPAPLRQLTGANAGCDTSPEVNCVKLPLYPWLYFASNGKVFYAGPTNQARWLNTTGSGAWEPLPTPLPSPSPTVNPLQSSTYRESGSSVMYDVDKVMISGGGPVSPVATNEVIDLSSSTPVWRGVASMAFARKHHNLTILADGKILATGGTKGIGFNNNCERQVVYDAEMWTPPTTATGQGAWSTMAKMTHNRRYHSMAVLLRDGRVLVGGSDMYPSTPNQCFPPLPQVGQTEIFTPPYLFADNGSLAVRPKVSSVQGSTPPSVIEVSYGSQISIGINTHPNSISKVTLIRLSSVTHSFNMNQRINYLPVTQNGSNLTITTPANSNLAPPGHYFMFVIDSLGVPSVAQIVRIS